MGTAVKFARELGLTEDELMLVIQKARASDSEPDRVVEAAGQPRPATPAPKQADQPMQPVPVPPKPTATPVVAPRPKAIAPGPYWGKGKGGKGARGPGKVMARSICYGCGKKGHKMARCPENDPRGGRGTLAAPPANPIQSVWSEPYYPSWPMMAPPVPCINITVQLPTMGPVFPSMGIQGNALGW